MCQKIATLQKKKLKNSKNFYTSNAYKKVKAKNCYTSKKYQKIRKPKFDFSKRFHKTEIQEIATLRIF
jgi:uncharacterized protein (DUF1330 family)